MEPNNTPPLDELVATIVGFGGPLTSIVSGMLEWQAAGRSSPDAPGIPEVLTTLLTDVLADLRDDTPAADLRTTASVLRRVTDTICSDLYVVDPRMLDAADT